MAVDDVRAEIQCLYDEIYDHVQRYDLQAQPKQVIERALTSEVVLIAQAPGSSTQRLSGIPYVRPTGRLSQTGRVLDGFLAGFGYTVDPSNYTRRYAYCTDMGHHYTGRGKGGDRRPSLQEIAQYAHWLDRELALIAPLVVVLLGGVATEAFFEHYLNRRAQALADFAGNEDTLDLHGRSISVVPVYHPAYRRRDPHEVDEVYEDAAELIASILKDERQRADVAAKGNPVQ